MTEGQRGARLTGAQVRRLHAMKEAPVTVPGSALGVMKRLSQGGLAERVRFYEFRITDLGRLALSEREGGDG